MTNEQKIKVIEQFDRAKNLREVKNLVEQKLILKERLEQARSLEIELDIYDIHANAVHNFIKFPTNILESNI